MHRRRKGTQVREDRTPQSHGPLSRSRRRPTPGADVPPQLRLPPEHEERLQRPPKPRVDKAPPAPRPDKPARPERAARPSKGGRQPVVLVTGFEPFGGETVNPSWQVCQRLPKEIAGARVEVLQVPCVFRAAIEVAGEAIERLRPAVTIGLGQAGGRSVMGVERVAINVDDARLPDNAGEQPIDRPVARDGPPAYFATVPVRAMVAAIRAAGVPAELSNTAGTFVCNHLMYGVLHLASAAASGMRAGFIHVPYSPEQVVDKPPVASMSIEAMARAVEAAIAAALRREEIASVEGTLD